jgi:fatty acid desaturase
MDTHTDLKSLQPSKWFAAWGFDMLCIAGAMGFMSVVINWSTTMKWPTLYLLLCIIAARQHAVSLLGHEGGHKNILKDRKWNDFVTKYFCFLPLGVSLHTYRLFHNGPNGHHMHVGTDKDPELVHKRHPVLGVQWQTPLNVKSFWFYLAKDFVGGAIPHILVLMKLTGPKRVQDILEQALYFLAVTSLLVYLGLWWVVLVWFMSLWFGPFWAVFRIRIWFEHVGLTGENHTHNMKEPNFLFRFLVFPHKAWLHLPHHNHAATPFYKLHAAQALDRMKPGYPPEVSLLEIFRSLKKS